MLSYKLDFSSCGIVLGFGKSSHILHIANYKLNICIFITWSCFLGVFKNPSRNVSKRVIKKFASAYDYILHIDKDRALQEMKSSDIPVNAATHHLIEFINKVKISITLATMYI